MKKYILLVLVLILAVGGFSAFSQSQTKQSSPANTNQVAASFYPLYYFASEIGRDKASVYTVTPNGVEPHDYEPTAQDIVKIQNSKMLLVNGAGFEPWLAKIQPELTDKNIHIVNATEGLKLQPAEAHEEEEPLDPHVWLSPVLAKEQVAKITKGYQKVDPQNSEFYQTNSEALQKRLDALHTAYQKGLATCQKRDFVTSHSAFGYLAKTYRLNQVAISGLSPDAEPSTAQLAEVTNFVRENNVNYIFFETLASPDLSKTIAQETGAETLVLDPIEGIPDDEIKQGKNYFTVMEANLKNLQRALACTK
jgi:zinc transport system substrate-binding protein